MTVEFDTSKGFIVPDDMNEKRVLWGIKFAKPVSLKRLLDAIADLPGGDIVYLEDIVDDKGNVAFTEDSQNEE